MLALAVAAAWLACGGPAAPAFAAAPVSCGQTSQGEAVLAGSCTGDVLMRGGRLNLAGHTLRGTVACDAGACEIFSDPPGGTVAGFGVALSVGIIGGTSADSPTGDLVIDGVTVQGFGTGIAARNIVLTNSRLVGNLWRGADALESLEAVSVVVRRNGEDGLHARMGAVALDGSQVEHNGGSGVRALSGVIAVESTLSGNTRDGVENYSQPALLIDSRVRANGRHGVRSDDSDCDPWDVLELRHTQVSGNGAAEGCASDTACADLVACTSPLVDDNSQCDTSLRMGAAPGVGWGVCEVDRL